MSNNLKPHGMLNNLCTHKIRDRLIRNMSQVEAEFISYIPHIKVGKHTNPYGWASSRRMIRILKETYEVKS